MESLYPVVLCGGSGSRLWPLSRRMHPKPMHALVTEKSLLGDTLSRVGEFCSPIVIGSAEHADPLSDLLAQHGGGSLYLEPVGRDTAPAATLAAMAVEAKDPDGLVLLLPADHYVGNLSAFLSAVKVARAAALEGAIVTFGVVPQRPEAGFGWIEAGDSFLGDVRRVASFVEKPSEEVAQSLLAGGCHYWNAGMFLFKASTLLEEMQRLQPGIVEASRRAIQEARRDGCRTFVGPSFHRCTKISLDYAVMEHTDRAAMMPVDMDWSDVGTWSSLWELQARQSNVVVGNVWTQDVEGSYIRSEGPLVAALGVQDVVVVGTRDAVLVTTRERAQEVRQIPEALARLGSESATWSSQVTKRWGSFSTLDRGPGFQVKRLTVRLGGKLSLQRHAKRSEHWVILSGSALVHLAGEELRLGVDDAVHIPVGAVHQLENVGDEPLVILEVQCGDYLGEDDIQRLSEL